MLSDWSKKVLGGAAVLCVALVLYPPTRWCGYDGRCRQYGHDFIWDLGSYQTVDILQLATLAAGVGFAAAAAIFLRK